MSIFKTTLLTAGMTAGVSVAVLAAMPALADESNIYINPAVGMQDFDNKRGLENKELLSIGVEYRFNQNWAVELNGMDSSPDIRNTGNDIDLKQYGIEGIYYFKDRNYFNAEGKAQPYGTFGVGHAEFDAGSGITKDNETQARLGLGVRYLLSDHWSIKADAKMLYGADDDTRDHLVTLGISYAFKGQNKEAAPAVVAAVDGDRDGVSDSKDQCPNTPAGVAVDAKGCALDSDNDGVADYFDKCPNTSAGLQVDEKGCKFVLTGTEEITLKVQFPTNSSIVDRAYFSEIEEVALFMKKYAKVNAVIEGYTDNTGSAAYNETLSQRRANSVMKVLVDRFGIAANRVTAKGYGQASPVESNDTAEGRKANRRVVAVMKAEVTK